MKPYSAMTELKPLPRSVSRILFSLGMRGTSLPAMCGKTMFSWRMRVWHGPPHLLAWPAAAGG